MELSVVSMKWRDKIKSPYYTTQLADVVVMVERLKWNWAAHVTKMRDDKWTKLITE